MERHCEYYRYFSVNFQQYTRDVRTCTYIGFIGERIHRDLGKINFTYFLLEVALQKCLLPCKIHSYDIVTYPSALDFSSYPLRHARDFCTLSCFMEGMIDNSYG